jgi:mono/diheme cytochrome c family protein
VRLQLALSLGEARTPAGDAALRTLVEQAGKQAFLADAVVSGLRGREVGFIMGLVQSPDGAKSATVATYATSAVLKSAKASDIDQVLSLAAADSTPEWARSAVLSGVKYFLPKSAEGKSFPGNLPAEPKPLLALAEKTDTPDGKTAAQLLKQLRWPGKVGLAASEAKPLTPEQQALFDKGQKQFAVLCATCHQPNGQGLAGLAPSLLYSRWVLGDDRVLARIVLNGKAQENLTMPPWRAALDDEAIAGVLTFVRRSWGHDANPVTPAVVAEARAATAKREEPWSDADLEDLLQGLEPAKR